MNDEELREAYARFLATQQSSGRAACPEPEALVALVQRKGPESQRLTILDHAMACAACQREFELLRAIRTAERQEEGEARPSRRWQPWLVPALAASFLLAIGLGPGREWLEEQREQPMRGEADAIVMLEPQAGATISADSLRFVWRPAQGASRYTVELLTADGAVAVSEKTADTTMVLPRAGRVSPGMYHWLVRAELPGTEARSQARPVNVRP